MANRQMKRNDVLGCSNYRLEEVDKQRCR